MAIAPINLASRGLTGERDPSRLKTGDLIYANNLDFSAGNLVQKAGGSVKVNTTALSGSPSVITGTEWVPSPEIRRRVVVTNDGKIYKDDMSGTFSVVLKSDLTPTNLAQIVSGGLEQAGNNRKLFIFTGNNPVQVLSGDANTTTNYANPPAEWTGANQPTFGFIFRNSLVAGGHQNSPHRVYGSLASNHENMTDPNGTFSLSVYPGESQKLVAGISSISRGFLWKYPVGIYWINDAATAVAGWFVQPATLQFGAAPTPHAVTQVDQGTVAFLTAAGDIVLMQETSGSLSGVEFVNLVKALNLRTFMRNNFNLSRLDRAQLHWYEDKKELHILLAALGYNVENRRLVIDFNEERTRVYVIDKDVNESMWFEKDQTGIYRPVLGDNAGFVWLTDQTNRTVDGSTYQFRVQTAPTDFSDVDKNFMVKKLFYRLHLEYEPTGNYDLAVDVIIDGKSIGTVNFNQGDSVAQLPFVLPAVLGGEDLRRRSKDIAGEGYYLSLILRESTTANPRLARAWVEFEPLVPAR